LIVWAALSLSPERCCARASIISETSRRGESGKELPHLDELFNAVQIILTLKEVNASIKSDESSISALAGARLQQTDQETQNWRKSGMADGG
jgi:hypothetical protein